MEFLNRYLSGIIMPFLLIVFGVFFAFKFKLFYILHPLKTAKDMLKGQGGFKSLSVALAGTLGIGNIVGVASAISMGGAGSVFWMWVSALCAMSLKYAEVKLSLRYRRRQGENFHGGAPFYINEGLNKKLGKRPAYALSVIFAIFCIINSLTTGNLVQINSVAETLPVSPFAFGLIFAATCMLCIGGGIRRIERITSVLIPILTVTYVLVCLLILLKEITDVPRVIETIFKEAFSQKSAVGGFCGYGILTSIRYGVTRGILSNEAGCGTSPTAHASSDCTDGHAQGCLGIFEVFVDTILLCSLTAFVILLKGYRGLEPMELVLFSFEISFGKICSAIISCLCVLFALATVITQYFYGEESLKYISKKSIIICCFKLLFCLVIIIGAVIPMNLMWQISDLAIATMTVINLICLFMLRKNL